MTNMTNMIDMAKLNTTQRHILRLLAAGPLDTYDLAAALNETAETLHGPLRRLAERGHVLRMGLRRHERALVRIWKLGCPDTHPQHRSLVVGAEKAVPERGAFRPRSDSRSDRHSAPRELLALYGLVPRPHAVDKERVRVHRAE